MIRHEYDENPTINHNFTIGILMLEHANVLEYIIVHSNIKPQAQHLSDVMESIRYINMYESLSLKYLDTYMKRTTTL